jgi:hypothetical protein
MFLEHPQDPPTIPVSPSLSPEVQVLDEIIELLADYQHWVQGQVVRHYSGEVVAYCLVGAIERVARPDDPACLTVMVALRDEILGHRLSQRYNRVSQRYMRDVITVITTYNDSANTRHPDVLSLLYRARARLANLLT